MKKMEKNENFQKLILHNNRPEQERNNNNFFPEQGKKL